ncbi:MAG: DUF664 domain-containing protein [Bacteroidetes bacterium]|nr:DUF664 domain-containing protein [Bacteroidota bacterium]
MSLAQTLTKQLQIVAAGNKKILERVPQDKLNWQPHEKSMTLGRLAMHLAELPHWFNRCIESDHFDFAAHPFKPNIPETHAQIMEEYERKLPPAVEALSKVTDAQMDELWSLKRGDITVFTMPRVDYLLHAIEHMVHHRGQLSVYLRLLDVPVPGMFGPSADER